MYLQWFLDVEVYCLNLGENKHMNKKNEQKKNKSFFNTYNKMVLFYISSDIKK